MKMLIVDDDQQSCLLLQRLLAKFGQAQVEKDGKRAVGAFVLALAQGAPFDLVCLDIMMPEMDGQTALALMRELERRWGVKPGREAKVVMTTAVTDPREATKAFFQGCATDYVTKPIDMNVFTKKIEELLSNVCPGEALE